MNPSLSAPPQRRARRRRDPSLLGTIGRVLPRSVTLAIFVSLLFLTSSAIATPLTRPSSALPSATSHSTSPIGGAVLRPLGDGHTSASAMPLAPHGSSSRAPTSNGSGTFFENHAIPSPSVTHIACTHSTSYYYSTNYCNNDTSEPSANYTSNGVLAVAYTADANLTECPGQANAATTVVAVATSTDDGANWRTPVYLSDPNCTGYDMYFPSAAQPAITSLSNGTLVLAYEQYNLTSNSGCYYYCYGVTSVPYFYCTYLYYDRIVVRESSDNGTTWSTPTVLTSVSNDNNGSCSVAGANGLQPMIAAYGDTVYVAWTNFTDSDFYGISTGVNLRISPDGGTTWGVDKLLAPVQGDGSGLTESAMNPDLLVSPNGTLYVAYLTKIGFTLETLYGCTCYDFQSGQLELATSTDNGSTFTYRAIESNVLLTDVCCVSSIFYATTPSLAFSATTGQLFVAYSGLGIGDLCYNEGTSGNYCNAYNEALFEVVANSSNAGATWSAHNLTSLVNFNGGEFDQAWTPSIAVTPDGVLHLQTMFVNDSICPATVYPYDCGAVQQLYLSSADNGTTFTPPVLVSPNWTGNLQLPRQPEGTWTGQYSTMLAVGSTLILAWTSEQCLSAAGYCYYPTGSDNGTVIVSTLYNGTGLTLTFSETGLASSLPWAVNIMGNERAGTSPGTLSVSGVPAGQTLDYTVPWANHTWGITYESSTTPAAPSSFAKSSTIAVTFTEMVRFTVATSPIFPTFCWSNPGECSNYALSPAPSAQWVVPGASQSITLDPVAWASYLDDASNMTFLSWTGTGPGNYTGLSQNFTVKPTGPVNETANFVVNGYCFESYSYYYSAVSCFNETYFPLTFAEGGLPPKTSWTVTTLAQNGTTRTESTLAGDTLPFDVAATPTQFSVWTVPDGTTGKFWVPTTNLPSPVEPIAGQQVLVNFTLENASVASFATRIVETGLPAGTPWSLYWNGTSYGIQANNTTLQVPGGGPDPVDASAVYLEDGDGFYAASVSYHAYVVNASGATSTAAPGWLSIDGPGVVTIAFKPTFLLTTIASIGGVVGPGSGWHDAGTAVTLNESSLAGYHFQGWAGSGNGSTTTTQDAQTSPTITPGGPVTEFATFRANPTGIWNLTVQATGLPTGTAFSVSVGSSGYSGAGTFVIPEVPNGSYAVSAPYIYLNSSNTTRFAPVGFQSSLSFGSGDHLAITANGTLTVEFQAQYLLTLASTPPAGGSIAPLPGVYWDDAGSSLGLTASPATGYVFVGWNSSTGALASASTSLSVALTGPLTLTAQFKVAPPRIAQKFGLTVSETGLPSGLAWNVSVGATGTGGAETSLTLGGLNGTLAVTVPTVSAGPGTRWTANQTHWNLSVTQNRSLDVSFSQQFLVAVSSGAGGAASPAGDSWDDAGLVVQLSATSNGTSAFVRWNGTGSASYNGTASSAQITVTSPVGEVASFSPVYATPPVAASGGAGSGMPLALGLLVGLLVVGLLLGPLVGSRGRGRTVSPPEEWQASADDPEAPGEPLADYQESPETSEDPPA
ncbi:MAG: hypothetical protein L3K17_09415 [Thermoplasmata archaeon]|nr:hypothetical protein [Thermoplasmata archaeon]